MVFAGGQDEGSPTVFKIAAGLPDTHFEIAALRLFEQYIEEKTENAIDVQIFPNNQLGDDKEAIELIQQGVVQMNPTGTSALSNFEKSFNLLSTPYLFKGQQDVDRLLEGKFGQELLKTLEASNLIGLGFGVLGFTNISNSRAPINTVEDIKGLKLRTVQNAFLLDFFKAVGANPVPMSFTELFSAMQQGVVDGQFNPLTTILTNNFQEVQPYISLTTDIAALVVFTMSKSYFESLSTEYQQFIREGVAIASEHMKEQWQNQEQNSYEKLVASGKTSINEVSDNTKQALFLKGYDVIENYGNKSNPQLFSLLKEEMGIQE